MNSKEIRVVLMEIRHELDGKIENKVIHRLDEAIEALENGDSQKTRCILPLLDLIFRGIPSMQQLLEKIQQFIE